MANEPKTDNRGQYMVRVWEDIKKTGGLAYSPQQIKTIFGERDDTMLTRNEVKERISAYFQSCITVSQDEDTQELNYIWKRNPTKSGLAIMLNVEPQTLCDYVRGRDRRNNRYKTENQRETIQKINTCDFDLLRKAYALIEEFYEGKLGDNRNNSGVIFWLLNKENSRWSNEQDVRFGELEPRHEQGRTPQEIMLQYGIKDGESIEPPELPE